MYSLQSVDDVVVLNLNGELSLSEIAAIDEMISNLMKARQYKVVLDFKEVEHVNYKTIAQLLEKADTLRQHHGDLKCASLSHYNSNILRFVGAAQIVEAYDSVYDAVMSFQSGGDRHRTWH